MKKWREMDRTRGKDREKKREGGKMGEKLEIVINNLILKKVTSMLVPQYYNCSLQRESTKETVKIFCLILIWRCLGLDH